MFGFLAIYFAYSTFLIVVSVFWTRGGIIVVIHALFKVNLEIIKLCLDLVWCCLHNGCATLNTTIKTE